MFVTHRFNETFLRAIDFFGPQMALLISNLYYLSEAAGAENLNLIVHV